MVQQLPGSLVDSLIFRLERLDQGLIFVFSCEEFDLADGIVFQEITNMKGVMNLKLAERSGVMQYQPGAVITLVKVLGGVSVFTGNELLFLHDNSSDRLFQFISFSVKKGMDVFIQQIAGMIKVHPTEDS